MTNAAYLIEEVCACGVAIEARVWISDPSKLPSELRQALRENQPEVVRLLTAKLGTDPLLAEPGSPLAEVHDDPDEREAIMGEKRFAIRQSIPQAQMVAGLLRVSLWQR